MLKKLAFVTLSLGMAMQAQAFEKSQVNLDKDFWGTWTIFNAQKNVQKLTNLKSQVNFNTTACKNV